MAEAMLYLNGEIIAASAARVSPLDRGLLYGDGVFETLRVYGGHPFALELHLERLAHALHVLRIDVEETTEDWRHAATRVVAANDTPDSVIRITVTRGLSSGALGLPPTDNPTRLIHVRESSRLRDEAYRQGVSVTVAPAAFCPSVATRGLKTVNYLDHLWAKQQAVDRGVFEAIWVDHEGSVVEGASSNVFVVRDGVVTTPPLADGILPGITRGICLELLAGAGLQCNERRLPATELSSADEVMITNSVNEIVPVVSVDGRPVGDRSPGRFSRTLLDLYRSRVKAERDSSLGSDGQA